MLTWYTCFIIVLTNRPLVQLAANNGVGCLCCIFTSLSLHLLFCAYYKLIFVFFSSHCFHHYSLHACIVSEPPGGSGWNHRVVIPVCAVAFGIGVVILTVICWRKYRLNSKKRTSAPNATANGSNDSYTLVPKAENV